MNYVDEFLKFIESLPNFLVYLILAASAFLENVFPPAPGDMIIAFGAFLVGTQKLHLPGVYISTTLGSIAGFMSLFWVGTFLDRRFLIKRDYRYFKAADIIRAEKWFQRYGYFIVFINRFLPGARSVISVVAGLSELRASKVFLAALASCCAWNLIWIYLGYALGSNWARAKAEITRIMSGYNSAILILSSVFVLIIVLRVLLKRRNPPSEKS